MNQQILEVTNQGKWFRQAFLKKEVETNDYPLAALCDLIQEVSDNEQISNPEYTEIAITLHLVKVNE
jgi:hypothetical protein